MEHDHSDRAVSRYTHAEEQFRIEGGYRAESDVHRMLAGLGLGADRAALPLGVLSGGERRRVELARILFGGTDTLILDEPTNHLDVDARDWLLGYLRSYRGALLVVSHDLGLLDQAITRVLHLDDGDLREYKGTYSQYLVARAQDEERLSKLAARQEAEIGRLSTLADKMRGQSVKRARTAKSIDKRVDRLSAQAVTPIRAARSVRYKFPDPPHCGRDVLDTRGLAKSFGDRTIWEDVSFGLERGERLLVLGLNGAGKTTLLRALAGVEPLDDGSGDVRARRLGRLLRAGARGHHRRSTRARPPARRRARHRDRAALRVGHVRARRRRRAPGRRHALGRREDQARAHPAGRRRATTCCCSTSPPTTSTRRRAPRWPPRSGRGRARSCW